jgi:hypothetical protein
MVYDGGRVLRNKSELRLLVVSALSVAMFGGQAYAQDIASTITLDDLNSVVLEYQSDTQYFGDSTYESSTLADVLGYFASNPTSTDGSLANTYYYVAAKLVPSVTGSYTLGESSAPLDTTMYFYEGDFDPTDFAAGFIGGNDDFDYGFGGTTIPGAISLGSCGDSGNLCPATTLTLDSTKFYTMVLSHYYTGSSEDFTLPQNVYVFGPGSVAISPISPTPTPTPLASSSSMSVLERVLASINTTNTNMSPVTGTFANIAENIAVLNDGGTEILNSIDGSVTNTLSGVSYATASVGEGVLAVDQVTVDIGNVSTTVLGAVNTGTTSLGVNSDYNQAIAGTSSAVSGKVLQLGGMSDQTALVLNVASNATSVVGSATNSFTALNGSVGNIGTTVLGAVNTGTISSGVNAATNGVVSGIVGG